METNEHEVLAPPTVFELFSTGKNHYACANVPVHIFSFTLKQGAAFSPSLGGVKKLHGTMSLVTLDPALINSPFNFFVYHENMRIAAVQQCMFTNFSAYRLIDRHVIEGEYEALAVERENQWATQQI